MSAAAIAALEAANAADAAALAAKAGVKRRRYARQAKAELICKHSALYEAMMGCGVALEGFVAVLDPADNPEGLTGAIKTADPHAKVLVALPTEPPILRKTSKKRKPQEDLPDQNEGEDAEAKKLRVKGPKTEKDPDAPKRTPSSYIYFQNGIRAQVKAANPEARNTEILQIIAEQWKEMNEELRQPYREKAATAMAAFKEQQAEYVQRGKDDVAANQPSNEATEPAVGHAAALSAKARTSPATASLSVPVATASGPRQRTSRVAATSGSRRRTTPAASTAGSRRVPTDPPLPPL